MTQLLKPLAGSRNPYMLLTDSRIININGRTSPTIDDG